MYVCIYVISLYTVYIHHMYRGYKYACGLYLAFPMMSAHLCPNLQMWSIRSFIATVGTKPPHFSSSVLVIVWDALRGDKLNVASQNLTVRYVPKLHLDVNYNTQSTRVGFEIETKEEKHLTFLMSFVVFLF